MKILELLEILESLETLENQETSEKEKRLLTLTLTLRLNLTDLYKKRGAFSYSVLKKRILGFARKAVDKAKAPCFLRRVTTSLNLRGAAQKLGRRNSNNDLTFHIFMFGIKL